MTLKQELNCNIVRINAGKELDYEISCILYHINDFEGNKIKESEDKIRDLKREDRKISLKILTS